MSAIQQVPDLPLAEPLRAALAEMDVVLRGGLIRGTKDTTIPQADREAAQTLREHYEKMLDVAAPAGELRVATSAAFREALFNPRRPAPARLQRAVELLRAMESGSLAVDAASELLDCIANVQFGTPVE